MARHLWQMLSAKGSSPAGDAATAQRRKQVFHVYMQAEPEAKKQQLLWKLGFASGWLRQGLHWQRGLSAQAGNQECKLGTSGHSVHGLVFQGVPRHGTEKSKWRWRVWRLCIICETVTAVFLNVCWKIFGCLCVLEDWKLLSGCKIPMDFLCPLVWSAAKCSFHYEVLLRCWGNKFFSALGQRKGERWWQQLSCKLGCRGKWNLRKEVPKGVTSLADIVLEKWGSKREMGSWAKLVVNLGWEGWRAAVLVLASFICKELVSQIWSLWAQMTWLTYVQSVSQVFCSVNPFVKEKCPCLSVKFTTGTLSLQPSHYYFFCSENN